MPDDSNQSEFLKSAVRPAPDCPAVEELTAAANNPAVQRHLEICGRCRTELAMLREFEIATPQTGELADVRWIESELARRAQQPHRERHAKGLGSRSWITSLFATRRRFALSFACGAMLVIIAATVSLRRPPDQPLIAPGNVIWRSSQFAVISPRGDVTSTPAEFRWDAVPGTANYDVQLTGVDGAILWTAQSTTNSVSMPAEIRAQLTPGRAFHWSVDARNSAGEKIAASDLQRFHILSTPR